MKVNCPMCGADDAVPVRTRADICKCCQCDLVYLRTRPTVAELTAQYATYASNVGSHMALPQRFDQLKTTGLRRDFLMADILAFTGSRRRRFLDIGSGWGAFLFNAREHGFQPNGIEICAEMADFATNYLGIPTEKKQPEDTDWSQGTFQVVSALHSLEHLPNQASALTYIHRILEPSGGLFCGIVPNYGSFCSESQRDTWEWLDPVMHVVQFTVETLTKHLWGHGFNVLKIYTDTGDFNRQIIINELRKKEPGISDAKAAVRISELNKAMKGEEIRFFSHVI